MLSIQAYSASSHIHIHCILVIYPDVPNLDYHVDVIEKGRILGISISHKRGLTYAIPKRTWCISKFIINDTIDQNIILN